MPATALLPACSPFAFQATHFLVSPVTPKYPSRAATASLHTFFYPSGSCTNVTSNRSHHSTEGKLCPHALLACSSYQPPQFCTLSSACLSSKTDSELLKGRAWALLIQCPQNNWGPTRAFLGLVNAHGLACHQTWFLCPWLRAFCRPPACQLRESGSSQCALHPAACS